jgi:hypothetical protein
VNDELERIREEAVVAYFQLLSQHSVGWTEESQEKLRYNSRSQDRDCNSIPIIMKQQLLINQSRRLFLYKYGVMNYLLLQDI